MARDSIELTFDPTTLTLARADATDRGVSLSRWMDEAARMRLRAEGAAALREFWSTDEGRELRSELDLDARRRAAMFDELDAPEAAA